MSTNKIPALYFDKDGLGPDHVYLEVFPLRGHGEAIKPGLSLRVRAGHLVLRAQLDGGYYMEREQIEALHRALGKWLGEGS